MIDLYDLEKILEEVKTYLNENVEYTEESFNVLMRRQRMREDISRNNRNGRKFKATITALQPALDGLQNSNCSCQLERWYIYTLISNYSGKSMTTDLPE